MSMLLSLIFSKITWASSKTVSSSPKSMCVLENGNCEKIMCKETFRFRFHQPVLDQTGGYSRLVLLSWSMSIIRPAIGVP